MKALMYVEELCASSPIVIAKIYKISNTLQYKVLNFGIIFDIAGRDEF